MTVSCVDQWSFYTGVERAGAKSTRVVRCRAMSPFGIESLPADIAAALKAVPQLVDRLDKVVDSTSEMEAMRHGIDSVSEDTSKLAGICEDVARIARSLEGMPTITSGVESVAADTGALPDMNASIQVLPTMDQRMQKIEEAMPVLVEVQAHLAKLPETIETLGTGLDRLAGLMDRLLTSMDRLDGNVGSLQTSIEPLGRIADRLPGSSPKK
jgi:DNA repair ATPase RecN